MMQALPQPCRDHAELEKLEAQVQTRLIGRVSDLRLEVQENGLVIRGRSGTFYAKQLAQHAVMAATPTPIAANEIEVS
jgi:hypothetical protein